MAKERIHILARRHWYNEEYPATDDLPLWVGSLNGQEFEREFLKEYTSHHADVVDPMESRDDRSRSI